MTKTLQSIGSKRYFATLVAELEAQWYKKLRLKVRTYET
jgi:hypothetical protein